MAAAAFETLFGKNLVKVMGGDAKDNETVSTLAALKDKKQIGIYFSAHWCPPCRQFTPQLVAEYKKVQSLGFEVVFASSDKDRAACKEYFEEMGGWLTLPYDNRDLKEKLSKKYKVQGIPTLVLLDNKGDLITTQGRGFIGSGKAFPYQPATVQSSLGLTLLQKVDGKAVEVKTGDALAGKHIALYFSAHWCPPCRGFTPKLAKLYENMKKQVKAGEREDNFEFIFVSSDKDESAFNEYYASMPWLALPFKNRAGKGDLSDMFGVRGIPSLVTLSPDGTVINKAARGAATGDPEGREFPWFPKPVNDVNDVTEGLNDEVCVMVMLNGATDGQITARKANLNAVAKEYYDAAKSKKTDPEYRFFYEDTKGEVSGQIRSLAKVGDGPQTILLDLGENGAYYVAEKEGDVQALLTAFKNKKLVRKQAASR